MLLKKQTKKMIAPIVITVLVISYFIFYMWLGLASSGDIPLLMKILLIVVPSGLIVLMVYLLIERVNEIKRMMTMILVNTDYISGKELRDLKDMISDAT